jgi:ketosteroid isomerase-like protein
MRSRVTVGIVFCLMISLASAKPKSTTSSYDFKARMQALFEAWSALDPAKAAPFYAKDADLDFYDIAPLKYHSWAEYADGVKTQFAPFSSAKFTVGDDVRTRQVGNTAWGTATWHGDLLKKDGSKLALDGRYTCVWEKRGSEWLLVHEHMSVPLGPPPQQ